MLCDLADMGFAMKSSNIVRLTVRLTSFLMLIIATAMTTFMMIAQVHVALAREADPPVITVLGDSLTAGYGLDAGQGFPEQLQERLKTEGVRAEIRNAGVSGDTTSGGLSRLDWSVGPEVDGVILELGANDALRGISPKETARNLAEIVERLADRGVSVLLTGMLAPPNMGPEYEREFNAIYPALADETGVTFYPFFLEGVAGEANLNQDDGIHPTAEGIAIIVDNMLPVVTEFISSLE